MLESFTVSHTFNKLTIRVSVDKTGHSVTVLYDRRIMRLDDHITRDGVSYRGKGTTGPQSLTPEFVQAWLRDAIGEHGNRMETLERHYRLEMAQRDH